ncbi:hypothetical protein N9J84_01660 [Porticoccaceae bacterium]|nr:hypothetical protein [Porticoccaceae bacterium]
MSYGTLTADGTGSSFSIGSGPKHLRVHGTWGGGTFKLQIQQNDATWSDIYADGSAKTYTVDDEDIYEFTGPVNLRTNLAGSTTPSLYWEVR